MLSRSISLLIASLSYYLIFSSLSILLSVLFRAVDETLCRVSASKLALRALSQKKSLPLQPLKIAPSKRSDGDLESRGQEPAASAIAGTAGSVVGGMGGGVVGGAGGGGVLGVGSPLPRRRSRSRGGSFGQQVIHDIALLLSLPLPSSPSSPLPLYHTVLQHADAVSIQVDIRSVFFHSSSFIFSSFVFFSSLFDSTTCTSPS